MLGRLIRCEMTQDNVTLLFFPDFSPVTAAKRKSLVPVLRSMTALGLSPSSLIWRVIKLRQGGEEIASFSSESGGFCRLPVTEWDICCGSHRAVGGRWPPSFRSGGRGLVAGMEEMVGEGGIWMMLDPFFLFLLSSLLLG